MLRQLVNGLPTLDRSMKRAILFGYDLFAMALALWGAVSARLGVLFDPSSLSVWVAAPASFLVSLFGFYRLGIYHIVLRYFDLRAVTRMFAAAAFAAATWVASAYLLQQHIALGDIHIIAPRSVAFIYCGFLFLLLFMGRYVMAQLLAGAARDRLLPAPDARKVVIYGANAGGVSLATSVRATSRYRLVGFVDPDAAVKGQMLGGVPVYEPGALATLAHSQAVDEVFLAMPNASRSERLAAIARVRDLGLEVKTVPAAEEIVSGRVTISDIRPIDVHDLLLRGVDQ